MPLCAHGTEKGLICVACYQDRETHRTRQLMQQQARPVFESEELDELHEQLSEVIRRIDKILARCRREGA